MTKKAWTPAAVPSLSRWWKADVGLYEDDPPTIPVTKRKQPIITWVDQSPNQVISNYTGQIPIHIHKNVKAGHDAVVLDGTGVFEDDINGPYPFPSMIGKRTGHMFVVCKPQKPDGGALLSIYHTNHQRVTLYGSHFGEGMDVALQWGAVTSLIRGPHQGPWINRWHVVEAYRDEDLGVVRIDGRTEAAGTFSGEFEWVGKGMVVLGSDEFVQHFHGQYGEVLLFTEYLGDFGADYVREYLQDAWRLKA